MTLTQTLTHLTDAFSAVRPRGEISRANKGTTDPAMDHTAKALDYIL
jgi:hypothetical protein